MCLAVYLLVMCDTVNGRMRTDSIHVSMTLRFAVWHPNAIFNVCTSSAWNAKMRIFHFNLGRKKIFNIVCVGLIVGLWAGAASRVREHSILASQSREIYFIDSPSIRIDCTRLTRQPHLLPRRQKKKNRCWMHQFSDPVTASALKEIPLIRSFPK